MSEVPLVTPRRMQEDETSLVLSSWKRDMLRNKDRFWWHCRDGDYWRLVNHVLDTVTLPSASVWMGDVDGTPLCWAAARDGELLYTFVRRSVADDAKLAKTLIDDLLRQLPVVAIKHHEFNPFAELERK